MSVSLTINGVAYPFPETNDENWGDDVTSWATAVSQTTLQKNGGVFTLSADVDFGASYGIKALYLKSRGTNVSSTGIIRLANTEALSWRNAANGADLALTASASDRLTFGGVNVPTISSTDTLTNKTLTSPVLNSPTGLVKSDVGLSNVDNTSDANKPVSTATQTALDAKENTITATTSADYYRGDKTFQTLNKAAVGLSNVDNTSDATKDAATATLTNKTINGASNTLTVRAASDITGQLPIANGGTGQATAQAAVDALLPSQASANGKFLTSDGTNASWGSPAAVATATPTVTGAVTSFAPLVASSINTVSSADYTILTGDGYEEIRFVTGNSDRVCTLPAASANIGRRIVIKKVDTSASTGRVTITRAGSDLIDFQGTYQLSAGQYDSVELICGTSSTWDVINTRPTGSMRLNSVNGYGSTNTAIRRFTTTTVDTLGGFADTAAAGSSFTVPTNGVYAITYTDLFGGVANMGLSVNSAQLTTSISSITAANRLAIVTTGGNGFIGCVSYTGYFTQGDIIRAHTDATAGAGNATASLIINRVS